MIEKIKDRLLGFTLIELLVTISIMGILLSVALFSLQGAREGARNTRRKSDIELIRSGLELYKSDCKKYPVGDIFSSPQLKGDGSLPSCSTSNVYISEVPKDPHDPGRIYKYSSTGTAYEICAALEGGDGSETCGGVSTCGGSNSCNYKATSP